MFFSSLIQILIIIDTCGLLFRSTDFFFFFVVVFFLLQLYIQSNNEHTLGSSFYCSFTSLEQDQTTNKQHVCVLSLYLICFDQRTFFFEMYKKCFRYLSIIECMMSDSLLFVTSGGSTWTIVLILYSSCYYLLTEE